MAVIDSLVVKKGTEFLPIDSYDGQMIDEIIYEGQSFHFAKQTEIAGESTITADNAVEEPIISFEIQGNTFQQTYEGYNLFDISKVNGAANANTPNPTVAGPAEFGTVSDGILHLKYGLYANGVVWTGAKITIKQGGAYYVSAEVYIDKSVVATNTRMNACFKNYTKQTRTDWRMDFSLNERDTWLKCDFKATSIPDDWVGDDVYLLLQASGDSTQYSGLPIYAKNIVIYKAENLLDQEQLVDGNRFIKEEYEGYDCIKVRTDRIDLDFPVSIPSGKSVFMSLDSVNPNGTIDFYTYLKYEDGTYSSALASRTNSTTSTEFVHKEQTVTATKNVVAIQFRFYGNYPAYYFKDIVLSVKEQLPYEPYVGGIASPNCGHQVGTPASEIITPYTPYEYLSPPSNSDYRYLLCSTEQTVLPEQGKTYKVWIDKEAFEGISSEFEYVEIYIGKTQDAIMNGSDSEGNYARPLLVKTPDYCDYYTEEIDFDFYIGVGNTYTGIPVGDDYTYWRVLYSYEPVRMQTSPYESTFVDIPAYPQEIQTAKEPKVAIRGKNLFGLTENDFLNGSNVGSGKRVTLTLKPNTQYTLSSNAEMYGPQATNIWFNGTDTGANGVWEGHPRTTTTDSNGELYILIRKESITNIFENYWIQLVEGAESLPYEPYFEPTSVSIPPSVTLDDGTELELGFEKLGNYANKLVVDGVNGKVEYVRNCNTIKYVTPDKLNLGNPDKSEDVQQFNMAFPNNIREPNKDIAKCSHLQYSHKCYNGIEMGFTFMGGSGTSGSVYVVPQSILVPFGYVKGTTSTYVPAFKAWLQDQNEKGTPFTVCAVVEPQTFDITNTEIGQKLLQVAKTGKGKNVVEITSNLPVSKTELSYWRQIIPNE